MTTESSGWPPTGSPAGPKSGSEISKLLVLNLIFFHMLWNAEGLTIMYNVNWLHMLLACNTECTMRRKTSVLCHLLSLKPFNRHWKHSSFKLKWFDYYFWNKWKKITIFIVICPNGHFYILVKLSRLSTLGKIVLITYFSKFQKVMQLRFRDPANHFTSF
jgi:hypothetical protein